MKEEREITKIMKHMTWLKKTNKTTEVTEHSTRIENAGRVINSKELQVALNYKKTTLMEADFTVTF